MDKFLVDCKLLKDCTLGLSDKAFAVLMLIHHGKVKKVSPVMFCEVFGYSKQTACRIKELKEKGFIKLEAEAGADVLNGCTGYSVENLHQ